jgi:trehalose 6-phosphate synthase
MHLVAVPLSARDMDRYYDGFSNATLWPLYHDAIATPEFNSQWWEAYVEVNDRFGAVAAACAADKATVWVHDYQLQLVPSCLRRRRPDVRIGLFNHVPFPGYEIFAQLPWRRRLVQGMLGADLIGFQRQADATNFLRACGRLALNPEGAAVDMPPAPNPDNTRDAPEVGDRRRVRVGVFPISIDFAGSTIWPAATTFGRAPRRSDRSWEIRRSSFSGWIGSTTPKASCIASGLTSSSSPTA